MDASQASGSQSRVASGSVRPHGSRSANPDKQISQIEKSVTHLLVATKQLLETLTQWSRGNAQEEEVSDVYVRLGYEFNLACRAFNSIGVDTSDLGPVPDLLRSILEDTLSQPASPQSLDNYLPRIRDIIINLLHGLKRKQSKLRGRSSTKDGSAKPAPPPRQASASSISSSETLATTAIEGISGAGSGPRAESRQDSIRSNDEQPWIPANASMGGGLERGSIHRQSASRRQMNVSDATAKASPIAPTMSSTPPPIENDQKVQAMEIPFPHPPPPPPKQDALTALQRGGDLERRASRRFSAYQISKHLGTASTGVPVIPPAQNSPIPNRGREVRESMSAVRSRASFQINRQRSANRLAELTPDSPIAGKAPARISEEREEAPAELKQDVPKIEVSAQSAAGLESPTAKTPEEFEGQQPPLSSNIVIPTVGATINGPLSPAPQEFIGGSEPTRAKSASPERKPVRPGAHFAVSEARATTPIQYHQSTINGFDSSPPQGKELTLFLQYKAKVKKFVLSEGYDELTTARLQLAFIEKFNWNTHNNGVDLPEIYLQDQVSGVRYEIEDLADIKDRSVLVLNVEVLDEVKKHFDEGLGGLRNTLEGVRSLLDGQGSLMQRFSDRQLETSKEMARLSAAPPPRPSRPTIRDISPSGATAPSTETSMTEIQNLRRDIAVLRQTYSTMSSDFTAAMKDIKAKAENVKATATEAATPSYQGGAGRAHVNQGKTTLNAESEALVNRVDDLSDAVEELRKDVVSRGVRPLPRQLEDISREIVSATKDYQKTKEFLKREKPIWTKVWEQELDLVCTEREDLTQREELMADMGMDLDEVTSVFKLVEEATKQQNQTAPGPTNLRSALRTVDIDPSVDPQAAKTGMLDEVRALRPNHEGRLEAIERAEKARQRELRHRKTGKFQMEILQFAEEGKLKKTGGLEEVERLRKIKDERARKENHEHQVQRNIELEKKRAERAAAKAAAAAAAAETSQETDTANQQEDQIEQAHVTEAAIETPLPENSVGLEHEILQENASQHVASEERQPIGPVTALAQNEALLEQESPTLPRPMSVAETIETETERSGSPDTPVEVRGLNLHDVDGKTDEGKAAGPGM